MKEKRKLNKGGKILLLFTLVVSSIFLLRPFTVKADINVNINKETQIVTDLIGQYSINYTGDANFFGFYGYSAGGMAEKASERPGTMKGAAYERYFSKGAERT